MEVSGEDDFGRCPREGSVSIRLDRYTFVVARKLLRSVTLIDGKLDRRWPCEDVQLDAASYYISVTRTHAGDSLYKLWLNERRLPIHIEIVKRGRIKNYTSNYLVAAEEKGSKPTRELAGYKVTVGGPDEFFDASTLGLYDHERQKVVFQCVNIKLLSGGRKCRASYPLDDVIDVIYEFDDSKFPPAEWVELDARLRQFVKELAASN